MITLKAGEIAFNIASDASEAFFTAEGATHAEGSDFWRLILDDGLRTEIPVFSHEQRGNVRIENESIVIEYDRLV